MYICPLTSGADSQLSSFTYNHFFCCLLFFKAEFLNWLSKSPLLDQAGLKLISSCLCLPSAATTHLLGPCGLSSSSNPRTCWPLFQVLSPVLSFSLEALPQAFGPCHRPKDHWDFFLCISSAHLSLRLRVFHSFQFAGKPI